MKSYENTCKKTCLQDKNLDKNRLSHFPHRGSFSGNTGTPTSRLKTAGKKKKIRLDRTVSEKRSALLSVRPRTVFAVGKKVKIRVISDIFFENRLV